MKMLTAAAAAAALLAQPCSASLLTISAFDDGVPIGAISSATGFAVFSASDPNFSLVSASATGDPIVPQPDLGSTTIDVTASQFLVGPHTLVIDILQTGLSFAGAAVADITGTFNGLIGAPGPATEDMLVDGINVASHTFAASNGAFGFSASTTISGTTSDEQIYTIAFDHPSQEFGGSFQFRTTPAQVPEPARLGLIGLGLTAIWFMVRKYRRISS